MGMDGANMGQSCLAYIRIEPPHISFCFISNTAAASIHKSHFIRHQVFSVTKLFFFVHLCMIYNKLDTITSYIWLIFDIPDIKFNIFCLDLCFIQINEIYKLSPDRMDIPDHDYSERARISSLIAGVIPKYEISYVINWISSFYQWSIYYISTARYRA